MDRAARPHQNIFACLVHEEPEVIWDLVSNLRCLDPASQVLLYNNTPDASLLEDRRFHTEPGVAIFPDPRVHPYGVLHGFMTDCMKWACENTRFDTITNVDSDQMLLHPGYTERLAHITEQHPNLGMLGSSPASPSWPDARSGRSLGPTWLAYPQRKALVEYDAWRPFLKRYDGVLDRFPRWTFWPCTVFSRRASEGILALLENSLLLHTLIRRNRIPSTEEVILPTLVDVLGLDLVRTPFDEACVRFKVEYTVEDLAESLQTPGRFWMHPVPRRIDHPLRVSLRQHYRQYDQEGVVRQAPTPCQVLDSRSG